MKKWDKNLMQRWNENIMQKFDDELWLLTPEEYDEMPDSIKLKSINGTFAIKGKDKIDDDARFGCLAFGLTKELAQDQGLEQDFLIMLLKS